MSNLLFKILIFYKLKKYKIRLIKRKLFPPRFNLCSTMNQIYFTMKLTQWRIFPQKDKKIILILIINKPKKTNVVWTKSALSAN